MYSREGPCCKNPVLLTVIMTLVKQILGGDDTDLDKSKELKPVNSSSMNIEFLPTVDGIFTTLTISGKHIKTLGENFRMLE